MDQCCLWQSGFCYCLCYDLPMQMSPQVLAPLLFLSLFLLISTGLSSIAFSGHKARARWGLLGLESASIWNPGTCNARTLANRLLCQTQPVYFWSSFLLGHVGMQISQMLHSLYSCGKTGRSYWLLVSTWSCVSHCDYLERDKTQEYLSSWLPLSL